ncbi:TonB-dependent receptor [Pistricoccus aurantiacus]|uniref:TonB-dependent receptor n=1 Tax=Pistricoccus aurantiacus TaxID=1883414 RepID=UPI0036357A8A
MKKRLSVGVAVLAGSASIGLQAQEAQDTMVVVGSRTPTQISQIPGAVWVIERDEIEQQLNTGADLKTTLGRLVPGMDLAPQGRTNFGQNLRGRSVQVLIDGVSLNSSRGLSRQFDSIDPFNIERVEVLSGASSLYGGGATGGIVNIITRKGESGGPNWRTRASVSSGFNDSDDFDKGLKQSVSGGSERLQGYLGVGYEDHGRFYDGDGDEIFPDITQTDLQDNRSIDVLGNVNAQLTPEQDLQLTGQIYRSRYEGDRGIYFPNIAQAPIPSLDGAEIRDGFDSDRSPSTERKMVNAQYHHGNLLGQDFYLQAFYREEEADFNAFPYPRPLPLEGRFGTEFATSEQNTKLSGIKALFDADLTETVSLTYGVDYEHEEFDANQMFFDIPATDASGGLVQQESRTEERYPSYEVDGFSGFLQGDWQASEALKLSAGVRQQHMEVDVDDFTLRDYNQLGERVGVEIPGGDNDYDATLFNASALYDFGDHQAWLRYSQGFELPDPAKYYGKAPNISVGENPLDAVETDQVELGWRYRGDSWMGQAAIYYAWSDKAVENNDDLSVSVIDEKKRDYGFEGAVTRYFDNGFETGGTLHLVRSEQKNDGDWDKRDVRYASVSSATAFLGWTDYERSVRLQANHNFDLEDDADQEIDGYTTLDLTMGYRMGIGELNFGVENLLDKDYSTVWGQRAVQFYSPNFGPEYLFDYQGRGRTYTLSWSMDY